MSDDLLHASWANHLRRNALLMRRRMRSVWPLAIVAVSAILNKVADYLVAEPWALARSLLDVVNTVVWPTVPFLLARRGRGVSSKL